MAALVAVASCTDSLARPPAATDDGALARVEWLLGPGALLNAVALTSAGVGAAVGEFGAVLVTSDAGETWTSAESGVNRSLRAVAFANPATAVAVGAGGTALRTEDGGHSWTSASTGSDAELRGVAFGGSALGLIVGEGGVVLRTQDAGRTWQAAASGTSSTLRAVRFASASVVIAAGDDGTIVRSVDGGATWVPVMSGTGVSLRGMHFVDATTGVVVGGDDRRWRAERVVLRTADAGVTWAKSVVPDGGRLYAVTNAGDAIVAVGEAGASLRSTDLGSTWQTAGTLKGALTSNWLASVSPAGPALVAVSYGGRILRSTDATTTWTPARRPDTGNTDGTEISAIALADAGALVVGSGSIILRSARGGAFEKATSTGTQRVFGMRFLDSLVGVAVGARGTTQRTVDGGRTWAPVESGTKRTLWNLAFGDDRHGVAVALFGGDGPGMIRTDDGGLTWHAQPCVAGTDICTLATPLIALAMRPSGVGLAVGRHGVLIKTTDAGQSWTQLPNGPGLASLSLLLSVALIDDRTAVVVGYRGVILHTRDGGATWTRRESGTPLRLTGVVFADASRGMIVGQAGTILTTSDGGLTWRREPARTTRDLSAVILDAAGHAVIAGAPGVVLRYAWPTAAGTPRTTLKGKGP